jgi:hypothetical protein
MPGGRAESQWAASKACVRLQTWGARLLGMQHLYLQSRPRRYQLPPKGSTGCSGMQETTALPPPLPTEASPPAALFPFWRACSKAVHLNLNPMIHRRADRTRPRSRARRECGGGYATFLPDQQFELISVRLGEGEKERGPAARSGSLTDIAPPTSRPRRKLGLDSIPRPPPGSSVHYLSTSSHPRISCPLVYLGP